MEKQSKAERLADALVAEWSGVLLPTRQAAAAELRRVHAVNAMLLEALKLMRDRFLDFDGSHGSWEQEATDAADAAIAAASDETSKSKD